MYEGWNTVVNRAFITNGLLPLCPGVSSGVYNIPQATFSATVSVEGRNETLLESYLVCLTSSGDTGWGLVRVM